VHITLCTSHSAHHTLQITLCTSHFAHHTLHITFCTSHSAHRTLHITLCTSHSAHHIMHITLCTSHFAHHILHITLCASHSAHHITHITICTSHSAHHTLHITFCTSHSAQHILHITLCTSHSAHRILHITLCTSHSEPLMVPAKLGSHLKKASPWFIPRRMRAAGRILSQSSPYKICSGQSGTGIGFSLPNTPTSPCQYRSTVAPMLIQSSPTLPYLATDSVFKRAGIATRYGLDGPGIESRWRERFSAPVQTGPGAHPASYTMGTGSLSRGESGRGVALTTHPHLVPRLKKESSYTSTPLWAFVACSRVIFTFTFTASFNITFLCPEGCSMYQRHFLHNPCTCASVQLMAGQHTKFLSPWQITFCIQGLHRTFEIR
jgi:hypothetical protein